MHYTPERTSTGATSLAHISSTPLLLPLQGSNNLRQPNRILDSLLSVVNGTKIPKKHHKCLFETHAEFLRDYKDDDDSLVGFLKMSYMSRNHTDLEKENAHFHISEAIISTIEHIKWNNQMPMETSTTLGIDCLTIQNGNLASLNNTSDDASPGEEMHTNSDATVEDDVTVEECLLSSSASGNTTTDTCAEIVGLTLISKFSRKHLPKISELSWLMSDNMKPGPLNSGCGQLNGIKTCIRTNDENTPNSSVKETNTLRIMATRGTSNWAPPRRQIIFTVHPHPILKELLGKQKFLCAGCGMKINSQFKQNFRYCTYFGKYHCIGCHHNQVSPTPAYILQKWDFNYYPVCVFAYRLLEEIYTYPLFYVSLLNPSLYIRSNLLASARSKRQQLCYMRSFIEVCRFATPEASCFEAIPNHITNDIDLWSMSDIFDVRSKYLHKTLDAIIVRCENHISNCVLCKARGFLCELCHNNNIIYPWMCNVIRCQSCGSCFHEICWKTYELQYNNYCSRCSRLEARN